MKILGTGLLGLVGSRITEVLQDRIEFEASEVDITNESLISEKIRSSGATVVLHLAAKANVDACEEDKGYNENGEAWKVNVLGTKNIAKACLTSGKKLIYVSTDFVFDGENPPYDENSAPNPINWYGVTKLEGEKAVQDMSGLNFVIVRIAYPYRAKYERSDFARAIIERLKENQEIKAVTDHIFNPTFVDDIAEGLFTIIKQEQSGIFHVVGSQPVSPYDCANMIAENFGFDKKLIKRTTRADFFKNRAQRPFRLELVNDKITKLGIRMRSFGEGLKEL